MVAAKIGTRQIVVLVVVVSCVALAGCSGTETTSTATPSDSGAGSTSSAGGAIHELTIANRTNTTDGAATALTLAVRANTTLEVGDLTSNPEPYFAVELNGQPAMQTKQVDRQDNGTFTIALNASVISTVPAGQTNVTVVLMEADSLSNDRVDAASIAVRTTPTVSSTPTQTSAAQNTATATPSPTQRTGTPEPTPTDIPEGSSTEAPDPTPAAPPPTTQEEERRIDSPIDGGTARRATVVGVVDADTIDVRYENGERDRIRLVGVDSPEPNKANEDPSEFNVPATDRGYAFLDHWAHEASDYAQSRLAGKDVLIVTDPVGDAKGGFDRTLAYVYIGGENFGQTLIEQGLARRYDDAEYVLRDEYGRLEEQAQTENVGVWGFESRETPAATPEPTPAEPPESTETPPESDVELPPPSNDGDLPDPYDCGDFDGYPDKALRTYMQNNPDDPSELDADGDGVACGVEYQ
jgi:micrococcal nuclease